MQESEDFYFFSGKNVFRIEILDEVMQKFGQKFVRPRWPEISKTNFQNLAQNLIKLGARKFSEKFWSRAKFFIQPKIVIFGQNRCKSS